MNDLNWAVRKTGALLGLLFGGLMLFIDILKMYYLAYAQGSTLLTFILLYPVYYIVLFVAALYFINLLRKKIGNYWNLRQAVTGIFIMLFVSSLLWNNGLAIFSGAINPPLAQKAHVAFVDARKMAMVSKGAPVKKIEEQVAEMNKTFDEGSRITVGSFFRSLSVSIILVFAVSILLGILFKRELPATPPKP